MVCALQQTTGRFQNKTKNVLLFDVWLWTTGKSQNVTKTGKSVVCSYRPQVGLRTRLKQTQMWFVAMGDRSVSGRDRLTGGVCLNMDVRLVSERD